jgi:alpha-beta hydrolase superfamily lysophospholipase
MAETGHTTPGPDWPGQAKSSRSSQAHHRAWDEVGMVEANGCDQANNRSRRDLTTQIEP